MQSIIGRTRYFLECIGCVTGRPRCPLDSIGPALSSRDAPRILYSYACDISKWRSRCSTRATLWNHARNPAGKAVSGLHHNGSRDSRVGKLHLDDRNSQRNRDSFYGYGVREHAYGCRPTVMIPIEPLAILSFPSLRKRSTTDVHQRAWNQSRTLRRGHQTRLTTRETRNRQHGAILGRGRHHNLRRALTRLLGLSGSALVQASSLGLTW